MMIKAGLTGGIGSGKSLVAEVFRNLGVSVYDADSETRKLYYNPEIAAAIQKVFPGIWKSNQPDFKALANIVFGNKEQLRRLTAILHPALFKQFNEWCNQNQAPLVVMESAILFETGYYKMFDTIILCYAPKELCIERVIFRDGTSRQKVLQRMTNQANPETNKALADYVIDNEGNKAILPQILQIRQSILKKAGQISNRNGEQ